MTTILKFSDFNINRETLEGTPMRAMQLLVGIASRPTVRRILARRGYTESEHQRGWSLLEVCIGRYGSNRPSEDEAAQAIAELDNWDEEGLRLVHAGLSRYPAIRTTVLSGLTAKQGPEAVLVVNQLLRRLNDLETSDEGKQALKTLGARGINTEERARLQELVTVAKSAKEPEVDDAAEDQAEQALLQLRSWFEEWSEVCRLVIKRRDYLITLGLAERRQSRPSDKGEGDEGDGDAQGDGDEQGTDEPPVPGIGAPFVTPK